MPLILSGDTGVPASGMPTGSVIQTVSTNKSDTFTSSAQTFSDVTGLSVSITPTSATSKILVILDMVGSGVLNSNIAQFRIVRDSTVIDAGNPAGGRSLGIASTITSNNASPINIGANFLDSPATTSTLTYKVQCRTSAGVTLYVNLAPDDSDDINRIRTASTITVMEIKG